MQQFLSEENKPASLTHNTQNRSQDAGGSEGGTRGDQDCAEGGEMEIRQGEELERKGETETADSVGEGHLDGADEDHHSVENDQLIPTPSIVISPASNGETSCTLSRTAIEDVKMQAVQSTDEAGDCEAAGGNEVVIQDHTSLNDVGDQLVTLRLAEEHDREETATESPHYDADTHNLESCAESVAAASSIVADVSTFSADSLEACLQKFCSQELLTGDNKFACIICTKNTLEEKEGESVSGELSAESGISVVSHRDVSSAEEKFSLHGGDTESAPVAMDGLASAGRSLVDSECTLKEESEHDSADPEEQQRVGGSEVERSRTSTDDEGDQAQIQANALSYDGSADGKDGQC